MKIVSVRFQSVLECLSHENKLIFSLFQLLIFAKDVLCGQLLSEKEYVKGPYMLSMYNYRMFQKYINGKLCHIVANTAFSKILNSW